MPLPFLKALIIAFSLLLSWYFYQFRRQFIERCTAAIGHFAARTRLCFALFALAPILLRLAALPWFPPPTPVVSDEFSHLLLADTLHSGRLANPSHPFWRHLETNYVLSVPNYVSIYPPGIGASLALGRLLARHPWAGILLVSGFFCGFAYWMLLGWLPPIWAFTGGVLATVNYGPFHPWTESYWGGGVAALGGAIVFGALPRFWRTPLPRYPAILLAGWGLVWFTRPYEALICALLLLPLILYPIRNNTFRSLVPTFLPALGIAIAIGAFFLVYNRSTTGSALTLPYQLYKTQYGVPQGFLWQKLVTGPVPVKANIAGNFYWQQNQFLETRQPDIFLRTSLQYLNLLWVFYAGYVGRGLPLLILLCPTLWRATPRIPLLLGFLAVAFLASLFYPFRQPQYLAHYASVFLLLLLISLQHIASWRWKSLPAGPILVTALLATCWLQKLQAPDPVESPWHLRRAEIQSRLERSGLKHLIFVHYAPTHDAFQEWVYNAADIDQSPVVWAQPLDPASDAALIRYFAGRKVWILQPDAPNRPLTPLQ